MTKMNSFNNAFTVTAKIGFQNRIFATLKKTTIETVFDFAYGMTFGNEGAHRSTRSGGSHERVNGETFINTFQGKLAEYGLYNIFWKNGVVLNVPDTEKMPLGKWDRFDFIYNKKKISVKSTSYKGNLLLLETKDWNDKGIYLPNDDFYDYHILLRVKPDGKSILRTQGILKSESVSRELLKKLIMEEDWIIDVAGFIKNNDLITCIQEEQIIPKGSILNLYTTMDAENYYVQAGDMKDIKVMINELKGE